VIFEVFRQEKKGAPFTHAGSVVAPDDRFAQAFAHEQYGRRQESEALWVVPREAVREVRDFNDELEKSYHRVDGYSLKAKLKEARERAATTSS
jgi:phenylacetate-CoA oxygenase PaaH subunit